MDEGKVSIFLVFILIWENTKLNSLSVQLRSNGRLEISDDGALIINDATEVDIGEYECIARNRMGDSRLFIRVKEASS